MRITIYDAQEKVKEFVRDKNWKVDSLEIFNHLVEEIGEVAKELRNNDKAKLKEELADVLFLIFKLCNEKDISLEEAFEHKFELIKKRFK
jgi:NTP pyrophosphatase (non-canonical NTP hydrolase)